MARIESAFQRKVHEAMKQVITHGESTMVLKRPRQYDKPAFALDIETMRGLDFYDDVRRFEALKARERDALKLTTVGFGIDRTVTGRIAPSSPSLQSLPKEAPPP
jgi:hypothetical protein